MIHVIQKPAPNFTKHAVPRDVRAAVIHVAEGSVASVDSWFASTVSQVSAHFIVGFDGSLRQYVSIHDIAWHAGRVKDPTWAALPSSNPNNTTVGIEHEGNGKTAWPEPMLLTSVILTSWLCERFKWEPSALTLPMHREIFSAKTCPGPAFDRENYIARVKAFRAVFGSSVKGLIVGIR